MEIVTPITCYNLRDPKGNKLELQYGRVTDDNKNFRMTATAQRWRFFGKRIPMPVRSGTWFQGLSVTEMLEWLRREGWCLESKVAIGTGFATVYKLPDTPDDNGNKKATGYRYIYENNFKDAIRLLCNKGYTNAAIRAYQYAHDCCTSEAHKAVMEIKSLDNAQ